MATLRPSSPHPPSFSERRSGQRVVPHCGPDQRQGGTSAHSLDLPRGLSKAVWITRCRIFEARGRAQLRYTPPPEPPPREKGGSSVNSQAGWPPATPVSLGGAQSNQADFSCFFCLTCSPLSVVRAILASRGFSKWKISSGSSATLACKRCNLWLNLKPKVQGQALLHIDIQLHGCTAHSQPTLSSAVVSAMVIITPGH